MRQRIIAAVLAASAATAHAAASWTPVGRVMVNVPASPEASARTELAVAVGTRMIAWICNTGGNDVYLALAPEDTVTVTVNGGAWLKAGRCTIFDLLPLLDTGRSRPTTAFLASIASGGTTTLDVETGYGRPPGMAGDAR